MGAKIKVFFVLVYNIDWIKFQQILAEAFGKLWYITEYFETMKS